MILRAGEQQVLRAVLVLGAAQGAPQGVDAAGAPPHLVPGLYFHHRFHTLLSSVNGQCRRRARNGGQTAQNALLLPLFRFPRGGSTIGGAERVNI